MIGDRYSMTTTARRNSKPRYSIKVGLSEACWEKLNKFEKRNHLIEQWCCAQSQDSSYLYCDECRTNRDGDNSPMVMETGTAAVAPVECPLCLWSGLTNTWTAPGPPSKLWKCTGRFLDGAGELARMGLYVTASLAAVGWEAVERRSRTCCGLCG